MLRAILSRKPGHSGLSRAWSVNRRIWVFLKLSQASIMPLMQSAKMCIVSVTLLIVFVWKSLWSSRNTPLRLPS